MSKIKGIDHGYLYFKNNEKRMFKSAIDKSGIATGSVAFITINGVDYSVGAGNRNIQFDKSDSEINKVTTITDLAMDGNDDYYLVCGLPIDQYKSQKDKFKKMIMDYNNCHVVYQGKEMKLKINDVTVLPQGIGALLSLEDKLDGDLIVFDFGGMTIDVAYIEVVNGNPILIKSDTWTNGIQKIYSKIITRVNEEYNLTLDVYYAEHILVNLNKGILIQGEYKSTDFLLSTLRKYLESILTEFEVNYPAKNTKIYLCGGSATIFKDLLKERYPQTELMLNNQFANALGYYKVGRQIYSAYVPRIDIPNIYPCRR